MAKKRPKAAKPMKRYSIWDSPIYVFSVPDYMEMRFTVLWQHSIDSTDQRAQDVGAVVWWYVLNYHLSNAFEKLEAVLPGNTHLLRDYRTLNALPVATEDLRGALHDDQGVLLSRYCCGGATRQPLYASSITDKISLITHRATA